MFIGHYAVAFALKGKEKGASLAMLFIATQFIDILFFPFAAAGIERMSFAKNFTATNNYIFEYYPFSHGLLGCFVWAALFYVLYRFLLLQENINRKSIAIVMALGVLSHWFADLIVHTPDLPLIVGEPKFGFGLWNNKPLTFATETVLLIAGLLYYLKKTKAVTDTGKYAAIIFTLFLVLINYLNFYVLPAKEDITSITISALTAYVLFAGIAHFIDKKRI